MSEYDSYLVGYQRASVTTEVVSATLNAGQSVILAGGLTAVLAAAAMSGAAMTAGDLVCPPSSNLILYKNTHAEIPGPYFPYPCPFGCPVVIVCLVPLVPFSQAVMYGWCRYLCKDCCYSSGARFNFWAGSTESSGSRSWTWMPSSRYFDYASSPVTVERFGST